ncbi:hypothetical protein [Brachybacterium subflavum]|uniref:hypothetical protein n=1 Tax=Brachybacterium subflavum TaxID=2585206 RepID=UPI0012664FC8|nr:hypothetical protein [Brachybacterium subflavum]
MDIVTPAAFPETLPEVRIDVLEQNTAQSVVCDELQWWFVVPRAGETSSACWYDRGSRRRTMARETVSPVLPLPEDPGRVSIDIRERTFPAGALEPDERRIGFTARLTSMSADFLSVDMDGRRSDARTPGFAAHPGEGLVIDGVRYQRRNCTGLDTLAITDRAVRLFSPHAERPDQSDSDSHG